MTTHRALVQIAELKLSVASLTLDAVLLTRFHGSVNSFIKRECTTMPGMMKDIKWQWCRFVPDDIEAVF